MKYRRLSFFILFILLFPGTVIFAQLTSSQVDSLVNSAMKSFHVPGVAVGIVKYCIVNCHIEFIKKQRFISEIHTKNNCGLVAQPG